MLRRVAVATLHYGVSSGGCGLIKWCYAAGALVRAPFLSGTAEVIVLTDARSRVDGMCWPTPRVVEFDETLLRLVQRWSSQRSGRGDRGERGEHSASGGQGEPAQNNGHFGETAAGASFSSTQLMKLQLISMVEFELILFMDS